MSTTLLRVVLDTSSLVSYILTKGDIMRQIITAWHEGEYLLLSSPQTRSELSAVLARPEIRERSVVPLTPFVDGLEKFSLLVPGLLDLHGVCQDPKDDIFIACAVEGSAHYLVSSDRDLLLVGRYQEVSIINPGQFLIALYLAKLTPEAMRSQYSPETLRTLAAELRLDSETHLKLMQVIAEVGE